MDDLRELYEDIILDHNRNPRNYGPSPAGTNRSAQGYNPLCGDEVQVHVRMDGDKIADVSFEGRGCAICTASASIMTESVKEKTQDEVDRLHRKVHATLTDEETDSADEDLDIGSAEALAGVKAFPMRVKCATLAWHTLQAAMHDDGSKVTTE